MLTKKSSAKGFNVKEYIKYTIIIIYKIVFIKSNLQLNLQYLIIDAIKFCTNYVIIYMWNI